MKQNQKGFSLVEVSIAMGISAVILAVVVTMIFDMTKNQKELSNKLAATVDALLGENSIFVDLRNIEPSFNNINVPDDSNASFFEYYPDLPEGLISRKLSRTITLQLSGKTEFYFLQSDPISGPMLVYNPSMAYNIGPPPTSVASAATLDFVSLNRNNLVLNQRPQFWVNGKTLMIDTPVRIRPVVNNVVDLMVPPRSPAFIGQVQGQALNLDSRFTGMFNYSHPQTGVPIQTADQFLRTMPSMGGGSSYARIRPVRLVRYYIEKQKDSNYADAAVLYKSVYADGAFSAPFLIMDQIKSIQFQRDTVNQKVMTFSLQKAGQ